MNNLAIEKSALITPEFVLAGIAELPELHGHNSSVKLDRLIKENAVLEPLKSVFRHFMERKVGLHSVARHVAATGVADGVLVLSPIVTVSPESLEKMINELNPPKDGDAGYMLEEMRATDSRLTIFDLAMNAYGERARHMISGSNDNYKLVPAGQVGFWRMVGAAVPDLKRTAPTFA